MSIGFYLYLEFGVLDDYFPGVDVDVGADPAVVFDEEDEVVFVLTVEEFLVGHVAAVGAFDEEGVVDEGDVDDIMAGAVGDADADVLAFDEAADGVFGDACADRGDVGASGGGGGVVADAGCAGVFVVGVVGELLVGAEGVVPVERAVGVGDCECEFVFVDRLAGEVLEDYVDVVGVFDEGDGVDVGAFVVGEELGFEASVEEGRDVVADGCGAVGLTGAPEGGGEVGMEGGAGGDCEVGAGSFAAPGYEAVGAGADGEVHHVAVGAEGCSAFAFLPDDGSGGGVDEVEGDGVDLRGKGVGIEHVVVEDKAGFVDGVAVALVLIDHLVAGA